MYRKHFWYVGEVSKVGVPACLLNVPKTRTVILLSCRQAEDIPRTDCGLTPQLGRQKYTGENRVSTDCCPGGGLMEGRGHDVSDSMSLL